MHSTRCSPLRGRVAAQAVVVRGEAGMGKTVLLDHAVRSAADGFRLARVEGVESEMELAYAGLHRMLLPLLAGLDGLPDPQRRALQSAFGLAATGAPDRFLIGLATLSLICDAARHRPLLCVIDDAQWLDRESLETMAIAARRLDADPVAMLFAGETSPSIDTPLGGLDEIRVRGLEHHDAAELVRSVLPATLDDCRRQPDRRGDRWITARHHRAVVRVERRGALVAGSAAGAAPARSPTRGALPASGPRSSGSNAAVPARRRGRTVGGPGRDRRGCHPPRNGRGGRRRGVRSAPLQPPNPTALSPPTDPVGCLRRRHCLRASSCARRSCLRHRRSEGQRPARMASGGRIGRLR